MFAVKRVLKNMGWLRAAQIDIRFLVIVAILVVVFPAHAAEIDWINEGWDQLDQNHPDKAIAAWQLGVNSLDNGHLLIQLGIYIRRSDALDLLRHAGRKELAIVLKAPFKGRSAYYVLSPRTVSPNTVTRRRQLASLRRSIGSTEHLYGNAAKKFKRGTSIALHQIISFGQVQERPGLLDASPRYFAIRSFVLHGNTLIPDETILSQIKPFLGSGKTRKDMVAAGKAIDKLYRSRGYRLSAVKMPVEVRHSDIPVYIVESPQSLRAAADNAATKKAPSDKTAAEKQQIHWTLDGGRSLKTNLQDLSERSGWHLVWEIKNDFQVGVSSALKGSFYEITKQIVDAYKSRGVLLKVVWFKGNKVMVVRLVNARNTLVEAGT